MRWIRWGSLFLCAWGLALAGVWEDNLQAAPQAEGQRPPNVVLIMADDFGFECVGANGGTSYATPVLDQLAREGARFRHCYAQPLCTPSRVKLMTGMYNVRNYEKFGILPVNQTTFANTLRDAGYATCVVGKWQLGTDWDLPHRFGFDDYCLWHMHRRAERYPNPGLDINGKSVDFRQGEYGPDLVSDHACRFIEQHRDEPFLLYYPMILTHCPFCATPDSDDWDPTSPGSPTYKGDPRYFGDMVKYLDKTVGKIIAQLDRLGLRENTLVLFVGDNGTDVPIVSRMGELEVAGAKGKMIDDGTHVPLIASWPGTIPAGTISDDLITFTDFYATLCEVAGIPVPQAAAQDGVSFAPQLRGEPGQPRSWIYCFYARNGGPRGQEFARNQRYKLYRNGKFFDVHQDRLETRPLQDVTGEAISVREMLQAALDRYADARPAAVSAAGQQPPSSQSPQGPNGQGNVPGKKKSNKKSARPLVPAKKSGSQTSNP